MTTELKFKIKNFEIIWIKPFFPFINFLDKVTTLAIRPPPPLPVHVIRGGHLAFSPPLLSLDKRNLLLTSKTNGLFHVLG